MSPSVISVTVQYTPYYTVQTYTVKYTLSLSRTLHHCPVHINTVQGTQTLHFCTVHSVTVQYTLSQYRILCQCTVHRHCTVHTDTAVSLSVCIPDTCLSARPLADPAESELGTALLLYASLDDSDYCRQMSGKHTKH